MVSQNWFGRTNFGRQKWSPSDQFWLTKIGPGGGPNLVDTVKMFKSWINQEKDCRNTYCELPLVAYWGILAPQQNLG